MKPVLSRRMFLLGLAMLFAARLGVVKAAPLPSIVVLSLSAPEDQMRAFEEGLRARGLIHGSTVILAHRTAGGRRDALTSLAAGAVALAPDVIVAVGTKAAIEAQKFTIDIPIVAVTGDMKSAGLVRNFSQPEGNLTGFSFFSQELAAKSLELLLEVNPALRRLKILMPSERHGTQVQVLAMLDETLEKKGVDAEVVSVTHVDDIEAILAGIASSPEESLLVRPSVRFDAHAQKIGNLMAKHRVIAMLPWKEYVEAGGLMSYSPDIVAIWREASSYVDRILRGARPSELPVTLPTLFELVVNLRSAQDLGLTIPPSILLRANRIIE